MCLNIVNNHTRKDSNYKRLYVFDSSICKDQKLERLVGFDNIKHTKGIINQLKPTFDRNLYQSFLFLLNFSKFLNFDNQKDDYFGQRRTDGMSSFLVS